MSARRRLHTPPPNVPANRLILLTASEKTEEFARLELTGVQLVPSFVERKTPPPSVAAKSVVPERERAQTLVFVKPDLTSVQLAPVVCGKEDPTATTGPGEEVRTGHSPPGE